MPKYKAIRITNEQLGDIIEGLKILSGGGHPEDAPYYRSLIEVIKRQWNLNPYEEEAEVDTSKGGKGILCPWCTPPRPISQCQHNPFRLMDRVDQLEKDRAIRNRALNALKDLKYILQDINETD